MQFDIGHASLEKTVIALDANVMLRLIAHPRSADIVDYLRTSFPGKLILPGQVIQEFWNNQFQAIATKSADIKKKFDELSRLMEGIDSRFEAFSARFQETVKDFNETFGYVFDDKIVGKTRVLISLLQEKAMVPFVPRNALIDTALSRKRTKTPPGFKDDLDGDFYVWSDLLFGLSRLHQSGVEIERVSFVTLDKKIDWSRDGVPHPILTSEVRAICNASFETITIDAIAKRLLD
ncbi:PIN-like domain-containing protein [Sphingomonas jeddahensis]|nr:PIN-like domain-containing protein [Sphingomonas jeddahensis]